MAKHDNVRDDYFSHWADHAARSTAEKHPELEVIVVAAGITPSGTVHIGNFREVITVDLVARALRDRGKQVRFIYSWDDFDVFRKVPAGMPEQAMLEENLRRSVTDVPDPFGEEESYAAHHIAAFEASITPLAIEPEFIRQAERYRAGDYAKGIRTALEGRDKIRRILDRHRTQPLAEDWLPLAGFCDSCGRDELDFAWDGEWEVGVTCRSCAAVSTVDLRKGGNLKLPWRVDWPMRWQEEGVCFEPGGKDHSSAGGSYDTAREIVAEIYGGWAPEYVAYDFVRIKGEGGKISSSSGDTLTVSDCLEIYEPEMLRWIFAVARPNAEFQISFDLDVIKLYEDFDRSARLAHQPDDGGKNDRKRKMVRRTLQLASCDHRRIEGGDPIPFVPPFRGLSMILQVYDGDQAQGLAYYEARGEITTDEERARFKTRARCVWNWIEQYAPDDFRYRIRKEPVVRELDPDPKKVIGRLVTVLEDDPNIEEAELIEHLKKICDDTSLEPRTFFPYAYDLILDRPKGPKLSTLVTTMGAARALPLLRGGLGRDV
ncbi:MAG: lysine--tRNA ligase [Deltaproteobacteria bacterium]|nr:lysine--tRNA ligase [Deltaproteobacteria bacterium]